MFSLDKSTVTTPKPHVVAPEFFPSKDILSIQPLGRGNINDTYKVQTEKESFVLQRINHQVFTRPVQVIDNLDTVCEHLALKTDHYDDQWQLIEIIPTLNNKRFYCDSDNNYWRCLNYLANSTTRYRVESSQQAHSVGWALGRFHRLLADLDPDRLHETIPRFHVLPGYLDNFDQVIRRKTTVNSAETNYCLHSIETHRSAANFLESCKKKGKLTSGIIHGDPKVDNILFDKTSLLPLCLIDLDTVGTGLIHYDLGDCLRSCCSSAATEDSSELENHFEIEIFTQVIRGYLDEVYLPMDQIQLIFEAVYLITFELGLRFFTDHLGGNSYFKVSYENENLLKAINQFHLMESIIRQEDAIRLILGNFKE